MPETIRLDRSKPFSTCHGERVPADPHYKVHFWQGGKMGGHTITLPFDVNGELVPDDGKTGPFQAEGVRPDGTNGLVTYQPLYSQRMRDYLAAKVRKMQALAAAGVPEIEEAGDKEIDADDESAEDAVNLVAWLKGEAKYQPFLLRDAAKKRYNKVYGDRLYPDLVIDLVLDEKLVREDELCAPFKAMIEADAKIKSQGALGDINSLPRVDRKTADVG